MWKRIIRSQKGQAMVELALLLPVLLLILGGIIEFGRIFHAYLVITGASREGARVAVVGETYDGVREKVIASAPSLDANSLDVLLEPESYGRGDMLTVTVTYPVDLVIPLISALLPDPFTIKAATTMRVE
ncbi:pilus assembly protein [Desulfofundulus sp. TPOSR]|jgi:Flp pilus assembly protein TadG|uniref:TadE/TadG family type IV pilus assembly protein n=1 Tax=Desulfofundulus sp. TPOSR TaxID=2714340 RepID=UPI00140CDFA9|nr:TadE/TadG family type IV pilus assembly protein [Desulfofundulus sp. TPOSR]NHM27272.1 pilus assembly protein [Desulfofundulus sp. TPOSR]